MKRITLFLLALILGVTTLGFGQDASAANRSDFNPGYIIDDFVFYNSNAMDAPQIQNFLNSKNPNCDYNGTQSASDWGYPNITHAQLAEYKRNGSNGFSRDTGFHAPPYKCLTMYSQATPHMEAASGYCNAISAGNRTAAQIINDVAKACGINPQVLIILLEKEQSLITDKWPLDRQLRNATGFACPDTAPCDPAYAGFFYQVFNAARQFKVYQAFPNSYNYRAGRNNTVYFHPGPYVNGAKQNIAYCGSTQLYIQNQATAALYIYTPYQPNESALNNLYGTGDICGSYGNRNFWRIFTDWFGSTRAQLPFQTMEKARWMRVKNAGYKQDLSSTNKSNVDWLLSQNQEIYFNSKITINGITYLRSQYDTERGQNKGIPGSMLEEIPVSYLPMQQSRWMRVTQGQDKVDPITNRPQTSSQTSTYIHKDHWVYVTSKITIGGKTYLRSQYDTTRNLQTGFDGDTTQDASFTYERLERPRWFVAVKQTQSYDLRDISQSNNTAIEQGTKLYLDYKIKLNGAYYLTEGIPSNTSFIGIPLNDLRDLSHSDITPLSGQRAYKVKSTVNKLDIRTGLPADENSVSEGRIVYFQGTVTLGDHTYLQSVYDTSLGKTSVISLSDLEPVQVAFQSMETPRSLRLTKNLYKVDPVTGQQLDFELKKNDIIAFAEKVELNGIVYLRTLFDTTKGDYKVIPLSATSELY